MDKNLKVALIHDYLKEYGGAERVLEALREIWPDAPLYTAYVNLDAMGENGKRFKDWDIRTSGLQKFPFANQLLSPFRLFAPMMFESFDLSEYDLVISSCNTYFAKAVITKPESLHISYIHTPPRYLYGYATSFNYKKHWWTRVFGELANHILRIYDFETSQRPDILVANSKNVAQRIKKFYRRDSVMIYPPVDISVILNSVKNLKIKPGDPSAKPQDDKKYFLVLSRLVRGKGVDVVVEACGKLGLPLKVAGDGPEIAPLRQGSAGFKNIEFLGWVSDQERVRLLQNAKALIVASEDEDFGIVPVESMATGTPVIAPKAGGFLESVVDGKTGLLYGGPGTVTTDNLMAALKKFDPAKFKPEDCLRQSQKFSKERFKEEILDLVQKHARTS